MKKFNFVILPYRGMDFYDKYGLAVRDLQMMAAIIDSDFVKKITLIERPLTIYEKIIYKFNFKNISTRGFFSHEKVEIVRKLSFDLVGPLSGRSWTERCYDKIYDINLMLDERYMEDCINVVLDFTPIANLNIKSNTNWIYWYDLIDNFSKHNRFSSSQKKMVSNKYEIVENKANLITGVSFGAISRFNNAVVVQNAVGVKRVKKSFLSYKNKIYDFGFIGFVTDKFDIDFIKYLSNLNYSIVVYGDIYDKEVGKKLNEIKKLKLEGAFHSEEIPELLSTFKVGLIPYIKSKMHDESPLKLYQYLQAGIPVLTSAQYDVIDKLILEYDLNDLGGVESSLKLLLSDFDNPHVFNHLQSLISDENYWDYKIEKILNEISKVTH